MFQHDHMNILPDMDSYGEYFATNEEYIRKYRFANAFHPFHGFSMMSCGHIAEMNTAAIYIVGAQEPGIARGMGLKTRATFEEALADAKKKFVGENPNILALPKTFKVGAVHLCMKDEPYDGTNGCGRSADRRDGRSAEPNDVPWHCEFFKHRSSNKKRVKEGVV